MANSFDSGHSSEQAIDAVQPMNIAYEARVAEARRCFQRVLPIWAQDVLILRKSGGDRLRWRAAPCSAAAGDDWADPFPLAA